MSANITQKIKLHVHDQMYDFRHLDIVHAQIDYSSYENFSDIFVCDCYNFPILDRNEVLNNVELIKEYFKKSKNNKLILLNMLEGTNTITNLFIKTDLMEYFNENRIYIISSGDFGNDKTFVNVDKFLEITGNKYNLINALNYFNDIYNKFNKPYKFLFLNKMPRQHRLDLISKLKQRDLLDNALWSNLSENILLPEKYQIIEKNYPREIFKIPYDLSYYDVLLFPQFYIDTYFSVVTETNFDLPYSYCTEKIYKPILMGSPFIVASNYKFYQHLKDKGYKTFESLIDESFDNIYDNNKRLDAIVNSISQLCQTNLDEFLIKAKPICDYNRNHFLEEFGKCSLTRFNSLNNFFIKLITER